jgi:adenosine kinase
MKRVIVTGSVANDYIMAFPGDFTEHIIPDKLDVLSVSFLVDSLRREPGGCAVNIAYNLALLGERPSVMATVGQDWAEDRLRLEAAGVDTAHVRAVDGVHTASFVVSTDRHNRQIASFYVGAMGHAGELELADAVGRTPGDAASVVAVVIAPNAPEAMVKLAADCKALGVPYVYDPSQQIVRLSGDDLRAGIDGSLVTIANEYEFELIREKTGLESDDIRRMTGTLVITHGEKGSQIWADGTMHAVGIVPPAAEVDPTGVGDAYRAGVVLGLLHDLPWPVAGRVGALCATDALEALGTQRHTFTPAEFAARYAEHFGPVPEALARLLAARRPA